MSVRIAYGFPRRARWKFRPGQTAPVRANPVVGLLALVLLLTACGHRGSNGGQTYGSPQSIASALGCSAVVRPVWGRTTTRRPAHTTGRGCRSGGSRAAGAAVVRVVPEWVHSVVGGRGWFVGCHKAATCEQVRRKIGGVLTGPTADASRSPT